MVMNGLLVMMKSLQSVHGVDFTDLICGVHRLFQNPDIRERWRSHYQYISVDEMQDTGSLEYKVMEMLWEGNHVLFMWRLFPNYLRMARLRSVSFIRGIYS